MAEGFPCAPQDRKHEREESYGDHSGHPHAAGIAGSPGLKTICRGIANAMRAVFITCWVIIVFGIAFYGVIGALHY